MTLPALPPIQPDRAWPRFYLTTPQRDAIAIGQWQNALPAIFAPGAVVQDTTVPHVSPRPSMPPTSLAQSTRRGPLAGLPQGIVLGLMICGFVIGFVMQQPFWLADWHWAFAAVPFVVLLFIIKPARTILLTAAIGLVLGRDVILTQPVIPAAIVGGSIVFRMLSAWVF
jgi:hypothetical protein